MTVHRRLACALFATGLLAGARLSATTDGSPDPRFSGAGAALLSFPTDTRIAAHEIRAASDGRITVAGALETAGGNSYDLLECTLDQDGTSPVCESPIIAFTSVHNDAALGLTHRLDGGLVLAGFASGTDTDPENRLAFAALTSAGVSDASFGNDGIKTINFAGNAGAFAISARRNGDLLFSGTYEHEAGSPGTGEDCIAGRMAADGTLDSTYSDNGLMTVGWDLGPDHDDECMAQALYHDGRLVLIADVQRADDSHAFGVARLTAQGELDTAFSGNGKRLVDFDVGSDSSAEGSSVAIDRFGRIVVAGRALSGAGFVAAVARLLPDGTLDPSFGAGGSGKVTFSVNGTSPDVLTVAGVRILPPPSNQIVLAGATVDSADHERGYVAVLREDGTLDPSFGTGGKRIIDLDPTRNNTVQGVALQGGMIVADSAYTARLNQQGQTNVIAVSRLYMNRVFGDDFEGGDLFLWSNHADP